MHLKCSNQIIFWKKKQVKKCLKLSCFHVDNIMCTKEFFIFFIIIHLQSCNEFKVLFLVIIIIPWILIFLWGGYGTLNHLIYIFEQPAWTSLDGSKQTNKAVLPLSTRTQFFFIGEGFRRQRSATWNLRWIMGTKKIPRRFYWFNVHL